MNKSDFNNILIIGVGVMGGTYLKTLQDYDCNIYAIEIDEETRKKALYDNKNLTFIDIDNPIIKDIDLVILTLYPTMVKDYMIKLNGVLNKDALVCEIAGIKEDLANQLKDIKLDYSYLLVHPMAGNESGGYDYSKKGIFVRANHIIINDQKQCSELDLNRYLDFVDSMGFNKPILMNAHDHDKAITYTSQLSHVIASALLNSRDYQDYTRQTIGDSFRDLTRIAKMNVEMWSSLFIDNNENLTNSIDNLVEQLESIKHSLNNKEELEKLLDNSRIKRSEFENDR